MTHSLIHSLAEALPHVFADAVVLRYAVSVLALLAFAALTLGVLQVGFRLPVRSAWQTFRGWLLIVSVVFLAVVGGRVALIVGVAALSAAAVREFALATGLYRNWAMTGTVYVGITALGVVSSMADPRLAVPGWYGMFMALPAFSTCALVAVPVLCDRVRGQIQAVSLSVVAYLYFGWMLGHLGFLVNLEVPGIDRAGLGLLLFLLVAVSLTDVASYVSGRLWSASWRRARRDRTRSASGARLRAGQLAPRISPAKTVAGAVGGLSVALAMPWLLGFSMPWFGPAEKLLAGLIVGIGAPFGDLAVSVVKRDLGIKDMGTALTGHGGVLDRIDSLVFVSPLFFHMVRWFADAPSDWVKAGG